MGVDGAVQAVVLELPSSWELQDWYACMEQTAVFRL